MVDTEKLREMVASFQFNSNPSNTTYSNPCKVEDIRRVVANIATVLNAFIDELEQGQ